MSALQTRILWILAAVVVAAACARWLQVPDPYRAGAAITVEDRREHRFRDYTWTQTEHLLHALAAEVDRAPDAITRARVLARIASLQNERGFAAQAEAAAREALRLAPSDAETRRLLNAPLVLAPR